jgi:hypothetical protein
MDKTAVTAPSADVYKNRLRTKSYKDGFSNGHILPNPQAILELFFLVATTMSKYRKNCVN